VTAQSREVAAAAVLLHLGPQSQGVDPWFCQQQQSQVAAPCHLLLQARLLLQLLLPACQKLGASHVLLPRLQQRSLPPPGWPLPLLLLPP
jgi:hypothetical protein